MKLIHKSYKFRIAPDKEQIELLSKHFGACRFVFNHYLNSRKGLNPYCFGRYFSISKNCNVCNYINQDLTLKDREWTCKSCNTVHDRDFNASINIKNQCLKILSGSGIESDKLKKTY